MKRFLFMMIALAMLFIAMPIAAGPPGDIQRTFAVAPAPSVNLGYNVVKTDLGLPGPIISSAASSFISNAYIFGVAHPAVKDAIVFILSVATLLALVYLMRGVAFLYYVMTKKTNIALVSGLKYDPRSRLHRLARDQTAFAP